MTYYYFETLISAIQNLSTTKILLRICKKYLTYTYECPKMLQQLNTEMIFYNVKTEQKIVIARHVLQFWFIQKDVFFLKWGSFQLITSSYFIISIKLQHIWRMCNSMQLAKNDTTFVFFSQGNKHSFRVNCHWMLNM